MTQTGGESIGYWVTIVFFVLVIVPIQFATLYILFRYAYPTMLKFVWQQLRTPAAKRWFVVSMFVLVIAELGLVIWIG